MTPRPVPSRSSFIYVEDDAASMARVAGFLPGRKDVLLLGAADKALALKLAARQLPEAILLNIHAPGIEAFDFLKLLRAARAPLTTPVIALGPPALPAEMARWLHAGFFYYLSTPLSAELFSEALADALAFAAQERAEQNDMPARATQRQKERR